LTGFSLKTDRQWKFWHWTTHIYRVVQKNVPNFA